MGRGDVGRRAARALAEPDRRASSRPSRTRSSASSARSGWCVGEVASRAPSRPSSTSRSRSRRSSSGSRCCSSTAAPAGSARGSASTTSRSSSRGRRSCSPRSSSRCRSSRARRSPCSASSATSRSRPPPRSARAPFATFRRITLPAIRPAVSYGIVLTAARSLGEFGAVTIVSGNIVGKTQTLPLEVQAQFEDLQPAGRLRRVARARALRGAHARRAHRHPTSTREGGTPWQSQPTGSRSSSVAIVAVDDVSLDVAGGLADGVARPVGLRQVDAPAHDRGPRAARQRPRRDRGRRRHRRSPAAARRRLRLPALRAVPPSHGAPERRVRARDPQAPEAGDQGARRRAAAPRAARRSRRALPLADLGRPAPADGARARARGRAAGAAARRAVRRARRVGARRAARLAPAPARRDRHDHAARDARSGRGDGGRGPGGRHARRQGRAGRLAARRSTTTPRTRG